MAFSRVAFAIPFPGARVLAKRQLRTVQRALLQERFPASYGKHEGSLQSLRKQNVLAAVTDDVSGLMGEPLAPRRVLIDGMASASEVALLRGVSARALAALGFAADAPDASVATLAPAMRDEDFFGSVAADLLLRLAERARSAAVSWGFADGSHLAIADSLLARLGTPSQEMLAAHPLGSGGHYWAPHLDKANVAAYDVSAILYLSTVGEHFRGGNLAFNDEADVDYVVEPKAGRLLLFRSGQENLHQVQPVLDGHRLALSIWFTQQLPGDDH